MYHEKTVLAQIFAYWLTKQNASTSKISQKWGYGMNGIMKCGEKEVKYETFKPFEMPLKNLSHTR